MIPGRLSGTTSPQRSYHRSTSTRPPADCSTASCTSWPPDAPGTMSQRNTAQNQRFIGTTLNSVRKACTRRSTSTCSSRDMRFRKSISHAVLPTPRTSEQKTLMSPLRGTGIKRWKLQFHTNGESTGYDGYKKWTGTSWMLWSIGMVSHLLARFHLLISMIHVLWINPWSVWDSRCAGSPLDHLSRCSLRCAESSSVQPEMRNKEQYPAQLEIPETAETKEAILV